MSQIAHPPTRVVSDFVRRWRDISSVYEKLAIEAKQRCEDGLSAVKCIVTERAKCAQSLEASIKRRQAARGKEYQDEGEIIEDMVDLAGVRIALYFPGDAKVVEKFIAENFDTVKKPVLWGVNEAGEFANQEMGTRFIGYRATHFRVKLKGEYGGRKVNSNLSERTVEIQVTSVVMHAWANVHHDLIYKPYAGEVTEDEKRVLDLINGLAHAGEVALQQLQAMLERRIHQMDGTQKFEDQYELATWLKTYVQRQSVDPKHFGPRMEYLKMLIEVLQIYQLDTPQQLEACFTGAPHSVGEDSSQFKAAIDNILHSIAPNSDGTKIIDETDLTIWTLLHICKTTMTAESGNRLEVARQKGFVMIQSINIALSLGQYTKKSFTSHSAAALQLIQQLLVPNGDPSIEGQAVRLVNTIWDVYMSELIFSHEEPPDWSSDEYQSYILWVLSCSLAWNGIVAVPESITKTPDQVFLWPGHLGWPSRKVEVSVGPVSPHIKLPPMVQAPFGRILPHTNTGHHASLPEKNSSSTLDSVSLYIFMYISAGTWKKFNLDSLKDVSSWKYSQVSMDKVARGQWIEETEDTQEIRTQELDGWEQGRWCYRDSIIRGRLPVYQPGTNSDYLSKQEQCLSATKNHPEEVLFYQNGLVQNGMQRQVDYKNGEKEYEHRKENDEVMRQKEDRKREEEDKKRQKEDKKRQESEESEERIDGLGRKRGRLVKEGPLYTHEKQEKPFEAVKKQDDYVTTGKGRHRRKGKRAKHRATEEVFD